jgi:hypothetical protein
MVKYCSHTHPRDRINIDNCLEIVHIAMIGNGLDIAHRVKTDNDLDIVAIPILHTNQRLIMVWTL